MEAAQMRYFIKQLGFNNTGSPNYLYNPKQGENKQDSTTYESTSERLLRSPETNGNVSATKTGSLLPFKGTTDP